MAHRNTFTRRCFFSDTWHRIAESSGFFVFFICIFISMPSVAQETSFSVMGTVSDKTTALPIEKASIQIFTDSSRSVKTSVTGKDGVFRFTTISRGQYTIRISHSGYAAFNREFTLVENIDLGSIALLQDSKNLREVVVTTRKTPVNATVDRKIYNVDQDILASSGSASDILRNVPSVEVDIEGQVSLRGSPDVTILINGRPSAMMGTNRAEVLQQLPANSIERIEVITNPSAKFRPDGSSGIINIVLKKNVRLGLNGSANLNVGNHARANGGLSLNYKRGRFSSFISGNIRQDERNRYGTIDRQFLDSGGKVSSFYKEYRRSRSRPLGEFINAGIVYTHNPKNEFGINGSYLHRFQTRKDTINREFFNGEGLPTSLFIRTRNAPVTDMERNATLYWQHNFTEEGHELRFEATASSESEDERNYYQNAYRYPAVDTTWDNVWVHQMQKDNQLTLDYTRPLKGGAKLELGYMGSFLSHDILLYNENYDKSSGEFVMDSVTSSHFIYHENIHAVYGLFRKSIGNFSFSAGLRAEQAFRKSELLTLDSVAKLDYFQLYPTLHLAYKVKSGEWQLNYSKRVNRPDGDALNPFPEYIDPLNLMAGNPYLKPEYIHSLELGYQIKAGKYTIVPSLYYRYKYNGFTFVTYPVNDSVLLTTMQNLSNDQSAGLEVIFTARPSKYFNANLSTNVFYNTINAQNLGFEGKKSIFSMSTSLNANVSFTTTTMLQVSANYRSARQTPQGIVYPSFVVNFGARQDLFKSKLSVTATLSDAFRTLRQKVTLDSKELHQVSVNTRDYRVFYLGMVYRFGLNAKKQEEKLQYDNNL